MIGLISGTAQGKGLQACPFSRGQWTAHGQTHVGANARVSYVTLSLSISAYPRKAPSMRRSLPHAM